MQIRSQWIALISISWNWPRRSCECLPRRKAILVHLIAKACLIRQKTLGLLGGKNKAETERQLWCPQIIWKSVLTVQACGVIWCEMEESDTNEFPVLPRPLGHCLVEALITSAYTHTHLPGSLWAETRTTKGPKNLKKRARGGGGGKRKRTFT